MRAFSLADVEIELPEGPRHLWKNPEHDAQGAKKDNFGDVVTFKHASGAEVKVTARDFGPDTIARGLSDLVSIVAAAPEPDAKKRARG